MTMDERLLEADTQARIDALDVGRSFIVQAPAGSGKTELLIQRYLNLLSAVENPEEVVAITFTKKATAEMQVRVLGALRRSLSGEVPEAAHERRTFELASRALDRSESLGWDLVGNPRRMRILTLDALNASIARSRPLSTATAGSRIVTGTEMQACYEAAAMATLDYLAEDGELQQATARVLQHVDNNTWLYASYLSQMLATRDQWLPFFGSGLLSAEDRQQLRQAFEDSIRLSVTGDLQRAADALRPLVDDECLSLMAYAAGNLREAGDTDNPVCELENIGRLPDARPEGMAAWRGLAELFLTRAGTIRKTVNKNQGFPPGEKARKDAMLGLLDSMSAETTLASDLAAVLTLPPVSYSDEQWQVLLALFRLLPLAVAELQRLFGERGISDHVEVAVTAGAMLGSAEEPGDVALLLDYQVKHLLVDEMQDTSAAQYRMLETLTAGWEPNDGRSLYCVGDPMQSVYRFRNAEVGQFLLAQQHGIGNIVLQPLLLRRNFRSGEHLVHWFNTVFVNVLAAKDEPLRGAVAYSDAVPVEQLEGQGSCHTHAIFGADVEAEASAGCELIRTTLDSFPEDGMTVLVRGRTQLPTLLKHLRKAGIPYRAIEIDRLTDLPEIIELLALTRAAVHPGDRIAWLAILRSPWIGLQWSDLHALVKNDAKSTVWELLQSEQRLASMSAYARTAISGALGALAELVRPRREQKLRDVIEASWFTLGGPGLLDDDYAVEHVYRYLDVLESMERAGTLVDVGLLESVLDSERVSSNQNARLQIMTMHRAKGLQFEHVLLYGLGRSPGQSSRRVLSWFDLPDQHGSERKIISPVGPRVELDKDPLHRYIEIVEAEKDRYEQARLLYVACTRAQKTLHLMGHTSLANNDAEMRPPRANSLLHLLWPAVEAEFSRQFAARETSAPPADTAVRAEPLLRRLSAPWVLPEPALPAGGPMPAESTGDERQVEFYWVGSDARIAGTLVHRWLQRIADQRVDERDLAPPGLERTTARWLTESGIAAATASPILKRVVDAVTATLHDEQGRWILGAKGHAELALTGIAEGELVSVVIDRVLIDDDGTHWIIDYKTSSHEGGNLQGFLDAEVERYRMQLLRYRALYGAWAGQQARCALYFPLLTSLVEIET